MKMKKATYSQAEVDCWRDVLMLSLNSVNDSTRSSGSSTMKSDGNQRAPGTGAALFVRYLLRLLGAVGTKLRVEARIYAWRDLGQRDPNGICILSCWLHKQTSPLQMQRYPVMLRRTAANMDRCLTVLARGLGNIRPLN